MYTGHAFDARQRSQQKLLIRIHILDQNLEYIVGRLAGDKVALQNFWASHQLIFEVIKPLWRVPIHADVD